MSSINLKIEEEERKTTRDTLNTEIHGTGPVTAITSLTSQQPAVRKGWTQPMHGSSQLPGCFHLLQSAQGSCQLVQANQYFIKNIMKTLTLTQTYTVACYHHI